MSRKFSPQEKDYIRHQLITVGKQLFATFGYRKTSINDLTKRVGIAQGTFYHFFRSKEALYFHILEQEENIIRQKLMTFTPDSSLNEVAKLEQILHYMLTLIDESKLLQQFFHEDQLYLLSSLKREKLNEHIFHDQLAIEQFIMRWREDGIYLHEDANIVASLLRTLFIVYLHREKIGDATFAETVERLIRYIANGLLTKEKEV